MLLKYSQDKEEKEKPEYFNLFFHFKAKTTRVRLDNLTGN